MEAFRAAPASLFALTIGGRLWQKLWQGQEPGAFAICKGAKALDNLSNWLTYSKQAS